VRGVSAEAESALIRHDWPGNVRELENAIEQAVVLGVNANYLHRLMRNLGLKPPPDEQGPRGDPRPDPP
jgi:DNA-binding NtrC family response regulator